MIISSEAFWLIEYNKIPDIISGLYKFDNTLEIHVIIYLRNQADYFESWYRECVETFVATTSFSNILEYLLDGINITIDENLKKDWNSCNYYKGITSINEVLRENGRLHIRNYDRLKEEKKDIVKDFFDIIGINISDKYKQNRHWVNPSLDFKMLEVKRIINTYRDSYKQQTIESLFMSRPLRQWLCQESSRNDIKEIKSYATDEQRERIWEIFREDNKRLSIEFLGKDEDLFPAPVKRGAVSVGETDYWKETVLILSGACLAVNGKNLELENKLNRLEASVQSLQNELLNYNHAIHNRESLFRATEQSLHDITNSRSWKLTAPLRRINKFLKRL